MRKTLETLRAQREEQDRGFTLIELLVVVVIIGILVAIAIPLYLNYRKGAENKSAESDLRGAISAVEQYYTSNSNAYPTGPQTWSSTSDIGSGTNAQKVTISSGNTVYYNTTGDGYKICAINADGKQGYKYDSTVGGSVAPAAGASAAAVCGD